MEKKKVIMKIESFSHKDGTLLLSTSNLGLRAVLKDIVEWCEKKYSSFIQLEMSPPYPKRTLPENNLYWAKCTEFARFCGSTKDEVSYGVKVRAMEMGLWRGKEVMFSKTGEKIPDSSATADTKEMATLIKVLDLIASEYGYIWEEDR